MTKASLLSVRILENKSTKIIKLFLPLTRLRGYNWRLGVLPGTQMVVTWQNPDKTRARVLARGNFSMGARGMVTLLVALAVVSLSLAALLAWQGFWPVFLVAAIQLVLVGWILIRAWKMAWVSETIEVCADSVKIAHQRYRTKHRHELVTAWTVIELIESDISWYSPRLVIRSGRKQVELGSFLTNEEKLQLHEQLQAVIGKHSAINGAK